MLLPTVLLVEDSIEIQELLKLSFQKENFVLYCAASIKGAKKKLHKELHSNLPSCIILDLMLPDGEGLDFLEKLQSTQAWRDIPVIITSALTADAIVIKGLELGAQDYVTKPYSPKVLAARINARIKMHKLHIATEQVTQAVTSFIYEDLHLDILKHEVKFKGQVLELSNTEFSILKIFLVEPGRVFSRATIIEELYGDNHAISDRAIDVQIVGLRRKLKNCGFPIENIATVRGVGYILKELEHEEQ